MILRRAGRSEGLGEIPPTVTKFMVATSVTEDALGGERTCK